MRTVVQRVSRAHVEVEDRIVGQIGPGLLVYVGIEKGDTEKMRVKRENRQIKIETANEDDIRGKQFYNFPLVCRYGKKTVIIGAVSSDNIELFRSGNITIILSTNYHLNYAGIQTIDWNNSDIQDDVFINDIDKLELTKDFFDYSGINQVKILSQYMDY